MKRLPSRIPQPLVGITTAALALAPSLASAHPGHYHPPGEDDEFDAFTSGLLHPVTGLDHLILAIAVGWIAFAALKGKSRLTLVAFIASLAVGAFTGRGIPGGSLLEISIAATLLAAGAAFLFRKHLKAAPLAAAICLAGVIHGFAHGSEAASGTSLGLYFAGFLSCTALLVAVGGLLHAAESKLGAPLVPRLAGAALLAFGSISLIHAL